MECFTVYSDKIEERIDPHFYRPEFKELKNKLESIKNQRLGSVIEFSNETWNQKNLYENKFPYIEIGEIDIETGEIQNITYYEKNKAPSRAKMIVRENDIIISTTRPHRGAISLIDKGKDKFIASTGFAILRRVKLENVQKEYLLFFLRTQLSLKQMLQRSSGGNYPAITSEELGKVKIPIPTKEIQNKIVELMDSAYEQKHQKEQEAQKLLDSINDYVLDGLGIKLPELKDKMCFISESKEMKERADPYFFLPKYKELYKSINNYKNVKQLKNIVEKLDYGLMPTQDYAQSEKDAVPMIRVTNIMQNGSIDMSDVKYIPFNTPKLDKKRVKENDILMVQCGSTTGKIAIVPKECRDYTFGSFSFVIRGKKEIVNQFYLFAILLNNLVQEQIKHTWNIVTVRPNTSKPNVENLLIPIPSLEIQNKIAEEVKNRQTKARQLQEEAKQILNQAKQEVEKIILG